MLRSPTPIVPAPFVAALTTWETPPEVALHAVAELHKVRVFHPVPVLLIVAADGEFPTEETRLRGPVPPYPEDK